jgi:hypothetical protein
MNTSSTFYNSQIIFSCNYFFSKILVLSIMFVYGTAETCETAKKRLKCVTGALAKTLIQKKYGSKKASIYDETQAKLQATDPKLELCYRATTKEFIILNSKHTSSLTIRTTIALVPKDNEVELSYTKTLPEGEKVLQFKKAPKTHRKRYIRDGVYELDGWYRNDGFSFG